MPFKGLPISGNCIVYAENSSDHVAEEFLVDKGTWIESKLDAFRKTVGYAATDEIRDGFSIKFLGEDMLFVVTECEKEKVYSIKNIQ